jgi:hypothetical protein
MLEPIGRSAGCPRVRGQCVNAKSDQRAQGNRKRPTGSGPSARLINGLLSQRGSASRAARTIIPATASPGSPSITTRPRPQQATAPHPAPDFLADATTPRGTAADNPGAVLQERCPVRTPDSRVLSPIVRLGPSTDRPRLRKGTYGAASVRLGAMCRITCASRAAAPGRTTAQPWQSTADAPDNRPLSDGRIGRPGPLNRKQFSMGLDARH